MPGGFKRGRARNEQRVRVDGNGLRSALAGEAGLADEDLARRLARLDEGRALLDRQRRVGFATLPGGKADLRRARELADTIRTSAKDVVVLGSGAVTHGLRAIAETLAAAGRRDTSDPTAPPRLHVFDRVEPARFTTLLAALDLATTFVDVIDVAGDDPATVAYFLIVRERLLRELGAVAYARRLLVTTRTRDGALRQIVHDEGFHALALPDDADGSEATLSPAALVPLASVGIDMADLRAGGTAMLERCREATDTASPMHLVALALTLAGPLGLRVAAEQPALEALATWIERRTTGVIGGDDAEARRDVTLVLGCAPALDDVTIPTSFADVEGAGYLGGQNLAALAAHERTAEAIARSTHGDLTIALMLPALTPHAIGQCIALIDAAILLARTAGRTPAAADTSRTLSGLVGRPGYEAERAAAQRLAARREDRYVA
jgi:glucose-6-phosphate isomerase